jgi:hypothetical protein
MAKHARTTPAKPARATAKTTRRPAKAATTFSWAAFMLHGGPATTAKHVISSKHSLFL